MKALLALLLTTTLVAGCSGLNTISTEVSSYGDWPAERKPGTYAFDRLPSQQAQAAETDRIEAAARGALQKAGFQPAPDGQAPDVLVQVGARTTRTERQVWADPLWWRGSFGIWRPAPWPGTAWQLSMRTEPPRYEREAAVLLRDRASGKPLYEAHATHDGSSASDSTLLPALFQAALTDFPRQGLNPRTVVVTLGS
ncbi:DUF4136 domain-containing protein [Rubrivivax sp. RP6-9]|uniref:DUF4136 domain-containing protein n=1 Tax=Rubrivivax sp. RP6-9 TaxID=3415750 RepID=UPI003CC67959